MTVPFLKEECRWVDTAVCWWGSKGRQIRGYLSKECKEWKGWRKVGGSREIERREVKSSKTGEPSAMA